MQALVVFKQPADTSRSKLTPSSNDIDLLCTMSYVVIDDISWDKSTTLASSMPKSQRPLKFYLLTYSLRVARVSLENVHVQVEHCGTPARKQEVKHPSKPCATLHSTSTSPSKQHPIVDYIQQIAIQNQRPIWCYLACVLCISISIMSYTYLTRSSHSLL